MSGNLHRASLDLLRVVLERDALEQVARCAAAMIARSADPDLFRECFLEQLAEALAGEPA